MPMASKRLTVLLTLLLQFSIRSCLSEYFEGVYFEKFPFHKLEGGNPFQTIFSKVFIQCIYDCTDIPECLSLNVADQPNRDGLYECVLLRNEILGANGLLIPSQFYHHYSRRLKDKCSIPRCKNGGTCETTEHYFRCHCPQRFTGKLCEYPTCINSTALGLESGAISDSNFNASSFINSNYKPRYARLHGPKQWNPLSYDPNKWLQVDLSTVTIVTCIATQGIALVGYLEWAKTYSLQYGLESSSLEDHEGGKIFKGNNDSTTVVKNVLQPAIITRYIRVLPKTWKKFPSLRMELYGCRYENEE